MKAVASKTIILMLFSSIIFQMFNYPINVQAQTGISARYSSTENLAMSELWNVSLTQKYITQIATADINKDGNTEIIVGSSELVCLDNTGNIIGSYSLGEYNYVVSLAIGDINNDSWLDIVVLDERFSVHALVFKNGAIKSEWQIDLNEYRLSRGRTIQMLIADLDLDDYLETIVIDEYAVYCIAYNGSLYWNTWETFNETSQTLSSYFTGATIAEIGSNNSLDLILLMGNRKIVYFNKDGYPIKEISDIGNYSYWQNYPAITDLDGDTKEELLFVTRNVLYIVDPITDELKLVQEIVPDEHHEFWVEGYAITDINNDSTKEIIVASNKGSFCYAQNGTLLWHFPTEESELYYNTQPLIVDVDGDKYKEVILPYENGTILVLNAQGKLICRYDLNGTIYPGFVIMDINNDGRVELIVCTKGQEVHCLTFQGIEMSGKTGWWCFLGSPLGTNTIDSDGDYLDDIAETYYATNASSADSDKEGLLDGLEIYLANSNPLANDTDNDMINDAEEVYQYHTLAFCSDTDRDRLNDYDEVFVYHTSPILKDTDGDGMPDCLEITLHFNPLRWDNWLLFYAYIPFSIVIFALIIAYIYIYIKYRPLLPKIIHGLKVAKNALVATYQWFIAQLVSSADEEVKEAEYEYFTKAKEL